MESVPTGKKAKHRKNATKKQVMALQLINQGMRPTAAMIKVGYKPGVAKNPKQNLFKAQAITNIVDKFQIQLKDEGITTAYLAKKYAEWLDAQTKFGDPEYNIQLQAGKMLKEIYNLNPTPQTKEGEELKRRITLEEFITPVNDNITPSSGNSLSVEDSKQVIEGQEIEEAVPHVSDDEQSVESVVEIATQTEEQII